MQIKRMLCYSCYSYEFADVFVEKPGLCNEGVHETHVTPDFKPRRLRAYKVPELLKPEVDRQLQELLDMGFIRCYERAVKHIVSVRMYEFGLN